MFEVLDFHAENERRNIGTSQENSESLGDSKMTVLIDALLLYLEENPMCLTHAYP